MLGLLFLGLLLRLCVRLCRCLDPNRLLWVHDALVKHPGIAAFAKIGPTRSPFAQSKGLAHSHNFAGIDVGAVGVFTTLVFIVSRNALPAMFRCLAAQAAIFTTPAAKALK